MEHHPLDHEVIPRITRYKAGSFRFIALCPFCNTINNYWKTDKGELVEKRKCGHFKGFHEGQKWMIFNKDCAKNNPQPKKSKYVDITEDLFPEPKKPVKKKKRGKKNKDVGETSFLDE